MNDSDLLNELELLQACEEAIIALLIPDADFDAKDRDNLGTLLNYLNRQRTRALDMLFASPSAMQEQGKIARTAKNAF